MLTSAVRRADFYTLKKGIHCAKELAEPQGGPLQPWSPSFIGFTVNSSLLTGGNKISGQDKKVEARDPS